MVEKLSDKGICWMDQLSFALCNVAKLKGHDFLKLISTFHILTITIIEQLNNEHCKRVALMRREPTGQFVVLKRTFHNLRCFWTAD